MEITKVEIIKGTSKFGPLFYKGWAGLRISTQRDAIIYKVSTDEGYIGYGEGRVEGITHFNDIEKTIVGEDPSNIEGILEKVGPIIQDEVHPYRVISGIEVALYDVVGKATGKRICELLGGRKRDKVRFYASAGLYQSPESYAMEALSFLELGFKGYKIRPAAGPRGDIETVKAIRDAVGDDFEIMMDTHEWWSKMWSGWLSYSPSTVRLVAKEYEKQNVYFVEEPFSPNDLVLFKDLKNSVPDLQLAAGESVSTILGFERLMEEGDIDIVQADTMDWGFTMCKKVAELVRKNGKKFICHSFATMLSTIQNLQLSATLTEKESPWCEYPIYTTAEVKSMYPFPLSDELLKESIVVKDGYISIPKKPGLGVEVNEEALKKYPYVPGVGTSHVIDPHLPTWDVREPLRE